VPRLDKFIQAMHEHGAKSLALHAGKPASLMVGDSTRPVTKEPLTAAQVTMLVKEIAPSQRRAAGRRSRHADILRQVESDGKCLSCCCGCVVRSAACGCA